MEKRRPHVPKGLLIAIPVFLVLGVIAGPIIRALVPPEKLASNILLYGLPFILVFIGILLAYISFIWAVASVLNNNVSARTFKWIERIAIAGILLGIFCIFQPWIFGLFGRGFVLLLASLLFYILWSHIVAKPIEDEEVQALPGT
ncbi:MAG: hypothetical protein U9R25_03730 [Chloroflexota bacterium]|nr:hypothetical protein [Chloroflexota bacterium]